MRPGTSHQRTSACGSRASVHMAIPPEPLGPPAVTNLDAGPVPTDPSETSPGTEAKAVAPHSGRANSPAPIQNSIWRIWGLRALLVLAVVGVGVWRYKITRPDYRLARGQALLRAGDWDAVEEYAHRLEAAGHADYAHLLRGES